MIPKKIHYVWVGGKELPPMAQKCLASWKKLQPDFEIIRWDESNSPMDIPYVKAMYAQKKWAFVSDYIRFWVMIKEGGIYVDTDMMAVKHFDDELLKQTFLGYELGGHIGAGAFGAPAGDQYFKDVLAYYDRPDKAQTIAETSPIVMSQVYDAQKHSHIKIYSAEYFNPCKEGEKRTAEKLRLAYTDHLWSESWVPKRWLHRNVRKTFEKLGIWKVTKWIFHSIWLPFLKLIGLRK